MEEEEYNIDESMFTREETTPVKKKEASSSTSVLLLRTAVERKQHTMMMNPQNHPVYPEYDNRRNTAGTASTLFSSLSSLFLSPPAATASSFDDGVGVGTDKALWMRLRLLQESNADKGVAQTAKDFLGNQNVDGVDQQEENPIPQPKKGELKINTTTESITLLGAIAGLAAVSVIFIIIMIYICYRKCGGSSKDGTNNSSSKGSGGSNNKYNNDPEDMYDHQQRHRNTNYYDDADIEGLGIGGGRNGKNSMNTRRDRRRGTNNPNNIIRDKNSRHPPNNNGRILLQHQHQPRPPVSVINVDNSDNNTIDDSTLGCDTAGRQPAVPVTNVITRSQMTLISDLGDSVVPPPSHHQSRKVSPRTLQQHQQQYLHRQLQQHQQQQQMLPQSYLNLDPMHTYSIAQNNMHHRHNTTNNNNAASAGNSANILFENRKYHEMKMQQMQNYSKQERREQHNHHHQLHAVHAVSPEPNHPTTHHPFYNNRNDNHPNHTNDNNKEDDDDDNERKNNNKGTTPSPNKSVNTTSSSSTGEEEEAATTPSLNDISISLNSDSFITLLRDDSARLGLHADLEDELHTPSMYSPVSTNVRMMRQQQEENEKEGEGGVQNNNNNNDNRLMSDHTKNNNLQGTFEIKNGKIIASTGTLLSSSSSEEGEEEGEDNNMVPPPFPPRQQQLDKQKRNSQLMSRKEGYNSYNYNTSQSSLVDSLALSATTDDEENFSPLVKQDLQQQHDTTTARGIRTKYALSNTNNTKPKYQHYISESSLDSTPDYGEISSQSDGGGGGYPPRTMRKRSTNTSENKSKIISKPNIVSPQTSTTEDPSSASTGTSPGTSPSGSGSGGDEQQPHHHHHPMSLHNMMKHSYAAATTTTTSATARSIDLSSDSSSADLDKHTHRKSTTTTTAIATNNNNGLTTINGESPLPQQIRRKYQTLASPRNRRFNKRLHSSGSVGVGVGSLQSSQLSPPSTASTDSSGLLLVDGSTSSVGVGGISSSDIIRPISNPWSFEATSSGDDTDYEQDENGERRGRRIPIPKESLLGKSPYEEDGTTSNDEDEEEKFLAQQQQESHKSNSKKYLRVSSAGLGLDGLLPQPPQDDYSPYESDDDKSNNDNNEDDIINNNINNKIKNHNNKMEVAKVSLEEQLSILESSQHNPHNSSNSNLPPAPPPISLSTPSPLSDRKRIPSITSTSSNSTTRMNNNHNHNQHHPHPISRSNSSDGSRGSSTFNTNSSNAISQRRIQLIAPPGKLGIVLLPRSGPKKRGTYVSDVKTYSSLYGKLNKGDRIIKIDNVNVSRMSVEEFIAVFGDTSKSQSSRVLTVVTSMKDDSSGGVSQLTDV